MNKRLQQFLIAENITQSQFAERIGVAKASVSHILSGRNKPGFEFIESMANCYPNLNLDWLIGGKGKMYKGQEVAQPVTPQSQVSESPLFASTGTSAGQLFDSQEPNLFQNDQEVVDNQAATPTESSAEAKTEKAKITKILVFYDNGTFKEIE